MTTTNARDKHVNANGLRLHYLDWEAEGKTPLICLHGLTGHAHAWDDFGDAMAPSYRVIAWDQRGHGDSEWAQDGYEREKDVADLAAFIKALELQRVVLCGHSSGGWIALLYAVDHPDSVERLIMVDIGPEITQEAVNEFRSRPPAPDEFASLEEAVAYARGRNPWASDERLRRDVLGRLRRVPDGGWRWKTDPAHYTRGPRDSADPKAIALYWRALGDVSCPVLLVRGAESKSISDEILQRMSQTAKRFSSVDVAGAGHLVPVDQPERLIEAVKTFLQAPSD